MARQLRTVAAPLEGPIPKWHLTIILSPVLGDLNTLTAPWAPGIHVVNKHTCRQNTHIWKKNKD